MIRPYVLEEANWKHVRDSKIDLVILPWGATEAHNFHLPYGTDNFEGKAIAEESAKRAWEAGAKIMVLPAIPFGVNTGQADIFLDINLNPSTQAAILGDILEVLQRQGVQKFMLLNSHGGNNWKSIVRELGLKYPDIFLSVTHWFKAMDKPDYFEHPGDHADEMETSLIMHLKPELVLPKKEWGDGTEKKNKIKAFSEDWAWTERPWSKITADTGVGNPHASSKEKGERFFNDVCEKMSKLFIAICQADMNDLYE